MHKETARELQPLREAASQHVGCLRERMRSAGCEFDFTVRLLDPKVPAPSKSHHRAMLAALFHEVSEQGLPGGWKPRMNLAEAQATRWPSECVTEPNGFVPRQRAGHDSSWVPVGQFQRLFHAFDNPPYGSRCEPGLFAEFCEAVGLWPNRGIEVLDWVGDPDVDPARSNWCDYFDPGKEWWGIWCLTVWHPERRTLAALAASSTD